MRHRCLVRSLGAKPKEKYRTVLPTVSGSTSMVSASRCDNLLPCRVHVVQGSTNQLIDRLLTARTRRGDDVRSSSGDEQFAHTFFRHPDAGWHAGGRSELLDRHRTSSFGVP